MRGTTAEATLEEDEPGSSCGPIKNSVWFSFTAPSSRELLVALDAAGDLDATVEVFSRQRSQLTPLTCQQTDRRGAATIDADAAAGTTYLVRVAPLANSVDDSFTLRVVLPDEPAQPPGARLPAAGTSGRVDRFANPDDAWSTRMREGRTYRINLVTVGQGCVQVALYASGDFGGQRRWRASRATTTPSSRRRRRGDTRCTCAPRALPASSSRTGCASARPSATTARLASCSPTTGASRASWPATSSTPSISTGSRSRAAATCACGSARRKDFDLRLLSEGGRRLACSCGSTGSKELTRRLSPGRYFIAVRARDGERGKYVLSRLARTITRATMLADGGRSATVAPGETVALSLRVTPAVAGRASMLLERYDPLAGWLFHSRFRPRVSGTAATVAFRPPFVGRWRVSGEYEGTRVASPSNGGQARFRVVEPLDG